MIYCVAVELGFKDSPARFSDNAFKRAAALVLCHYLEGIYNPPQPQIAGKLLVAAGKKNAQHEWKTKSIFCVFAQADFRN